MRKLTQLKLKLGITDNSKDKLLRLLLEEARQHILCHTKRTEAQWLPGFDSIQLEIAVVNYGRLGAEGVKSRKEGEISTDFSEDYPGGITKTLDQYRLVKGSFFR